MKTRIEEAAKDYGNKAMGNMSPRNDDYGISHYNLIQGFIAGAEFMKQSYDTYVERDEMVKKLKAQNEIMSKDLDQCGNELFSQEGKIKELEANLQGAITAMDEFVNDANDDELDTSDTLEHHAMMTRRALEKIKGTK
jgi:hypothetical protein